MAWSDLFKIFTYSFESDPISKRKKSHDFTGAGVTQPDAMPDLRNDGWGGKGTIQLRDTNDFLDLSTVSNRPARYREYDRLRNIAEIDYALTVMADETCLAGDTKIATLFDGLVEIKDLVNRTEPFLVYCWDFQKNDYTLGWAYDARVVRKAKTMKVLFDDGTSIVCTPEHRILRRNGQWAAAGTLKQGEELMAFYRIRPFQELTNIKVNQFPRIYTHNDGWKHERQFIEEWKSGKTPEKYKRVNKACRMLSQGLTVRETAKLMGHQWNSIEKWINKEGFSTTELKWLGNKSQSRRIIGIITGPEIDVYDLSVKEHQNFCGESVVFHNCQRGENGHMFTIECEDQEVQEELDFVMFDREMLNIDRKMWNETLQLLIKGDRFWELVVDPDNPKSGVMKLQSLPPETMFRIETTKGKLIEFQQSKDQPDYEAVARLPVAHATEAELRGSKVIRFTPDQVIHIKIGDDRQEFYPYGVSIIEAARGPAHQLRLMEDAMLVYRLTRAPERRVFYIDVGQLPPYKAEALVERIKDQFRKKKVPRAGGQGASAVEERWHAPAQDEDYWLPIRPNSNTRIETLPGAQNLGEVDDVKYFRDKLFLALHFPKNYFNTEDAQATRITLSAQDVKFARMIERIQEHIADALWHLADRHLKLRGYPKERYKSLKIKLTPPSDWREMSRAEVVTNRINNANALKGSLLMPDWDILTRILKYNHGEAEEMLSRLKMQKLEELKLQVFAQNPQLLGIGVPGSGGQEIGSETGGPNPMLGPDQQQGQDQGQPGQDQSQGQQPPAQPGAVPGAGGEQEDQKNPFPNNGVSLPDPHPMDLKKYDLQVQTYSSEQDHEDIDYSTEA